jgi:hypothetical protein
MIGTFKATGDSKSVYMRAALGERAGKGTLFVTSAVIVDVVRDCSPLTTFETDSSLEMVEDGPFMNLESHFVETVKAFEDWYWMVLQDGYESRYSWTSGVDKFTAFYETLMFQEIEPLKRQFAHWIKLIVSAYSTDRPNWGAKIDGSKLDDLLLVARQDPQLRAHFFDNPERKHVTEIIEWKILCAAKTNPTFAEVHHHIWMMSINCTFFVTKSGYMGTAWRSIRPGDVVALIPGVNMPMILRRKNKDEDFYTVIASAYVHGMMKGEIWEEAEKRLETIILY